MSVINTNITSMIGQQNLNASKSALTTSMERLSSGLRINSAKDDAAGQAIANRMSSQITGLAQAQRNANDGISLAQTAEGGLDQINDNLQRIRELTVQAQNGTNSASDIDSIQQEVNQRLEEIDRIAGETDFNGSKILSDSSAEKTFSIQVGAKDGETIDIKISANSSWNKYTDTAGDSGYTAAADLTAIDGEARTVAAKGFDVRAAGSAGTAATPAVNASGISSLTSGDFANIDTLDGVYSYTDVGGNTAYAAVGETSTPGTDTAYTVTFDSAGAVNITTTELTGADLAAATGSSTAITDGTELVAASAGTPASGPLSTLDAALQSVDTQRSKLGAIQNRFESAITNLSTNETNISAARSRIEDADYAVEVANMTRAQILQQAGTSVLAQANQVPQSVLSLLG